ncbi:helix-turn-helix domain-containing protein [uncultured Microbacterium sp.]|uniref:helix-turn-helix domain-containing protein n=1 Tax=uncultured Microbacterium sp. TaxID=191216 RepID=UPI0025CD10A4|nr:helix-turn-helix domain-containing protein [uncultured Microbacterium sp.]
MSYKATHWAWELGLKMPEKFVLVALADMADEQHSCFPGQTTLAQMTGASESTVRRAVRKLEDLGLLNREERRSAGGYRTSDRYLLQVGASPKDNRSDCAVGGEPASQIDEPHRSDSTTSPVRVTGTYRKNHQRTTREPPVARKAAAHRLPEDWSPNLACRTFAMENNIDVDHEAAQFRAHAEANDRRQQKWDAAFRQWLGNAVKWRRPQAEPGLDFGRDEWMYRA